MDLGSLFSGPTPAGPQPVAVSAGFTPEGGASPDAAAAGAFGSLVDLALEQLAGDVARPAASQGSGAPTPAPAGEDVDTSDTADERLDAPVDAVGLSVLIALASPIAVPPAEAPVPPPAAGAGVVEADRVTAAIGDRAVAVAPPAAVEIPVAAAAAAPTDGAFEAALEAIAAEEPPAAAASSDTAPARPAETTPAPAGAPAAARAPAARAGASRELKPAVAAIVSALAPGGSPDALVATHDGPSPETIAAAGAGLAPVTGEAPARPDAPVRAASIAPTAQTPEAPRIGADGAASFGDASADASTAGRFMLPASPARTAAGASRALDVAVAAEPAAASSSGVAAPLGVAPMLADVQPFARAFDAPVTAGRFEHTLAAVDPDTRNLQAMVRTVRLFTAGEGAGEARLQLEPDHLGPVALTVRVEQGSVSAHFRAETPAAQRWIETHQQELRAGLREQGLEVKEVVVTTDPDGRRERQPEPQPRRPRARRTDVDAPRFEVVV